MKSILPLSLIGICIAVYFFYVSPTVGEVKTLRAKKAEYSNVLQKAQELKVKRDAILTEYSSLSEDEVSRLNKIIPDKFDTVLFANDIFSMASQSGLSFSDFKAVSPTTDSRSGVEVEVPDTSLYKTNPVTFKLKGTYLQFLKLLPKFEASLHLMDITGLHIRPSVDPKTPEGVEILVELNTYSLK